MWDLSEYHKCGIWASTRNVGSGEYWEGNIRVNTAKGRIQASTGNVGSGRVQKCGIWASTGKVTSG